MSIPQVNKTFMITLGDPNVPLTAPMQPGYVFPQNVLQSFNPNFSTQVWKTGANLNQTHLSCMVNGVVNYLMVSSQVSGIIVQTTTNQNLATLWSIDGNGNVKLYDSTGEINLYMNYNQTNVLLSTDPFAWLFTEPVDALSVGNYFTFASLNDINKVFQVGPSNGSIMVMEPYANGNLNQLFKISSNLVPVEGQISQANIMGTGNNYIYWGTNPYPSLLTNNAKSNLYTWSFEDDGYGRAFITAYNGPNLAGWLELIGDRPGIASMQNRNDNKQKWVFKKGSTNVPQGRRPHDH